MLEEIVEKLMRELVIDLSVISKSYGVSPFVLRRQLENLKGISFDNNKVVVENRIELALSSIEIGIDPKIAARHLSWKEFERETAEILDRFGYIVIEGYRFRSGGRGEIDVIGIDNSCRVLVIDCKHWNPNNTVPSRLRYVVEHHKKRVERLARDPVFYELLSKKCSSFYLEKPILIPVILILYSKVKRVFNGVPVVPISYFVSFLRGIDFLLDTIEFYYMEFIDK